MPISNIFRRASNFIYGGETEGKQIDDYADNEILFCKNNVCVHPPTFVRQEFDVIHYPGYLTVSTKIFTDQHNNVRRPTLFLNWIPNCTLRRCPSTVEKCNPDDFNYPNGHIISIDEKYIDNKYSFIDSLKNQNHSELNNIHKKNLSNDPALSAFSDTSESVSLSSNSDKFSVNSSELKANQINSNTNGEDEFCLDSNRREDAVQQEETKEINDLDSEIRPLIPEEIKTNPFDKCIRSQSMTSVNITIANPTIENMELTPEGQMSDRFCRSLSLSSCDENNPNWMSTPEFLALKHNLTFPESVTASPVVHRKSPPKCRR